MGRLDRSRAGVEQHETAGAISVFGLADIETGLADQGGLLIAQRAADRHRRSQGTLLEGVAPGLFVDGWHDAGQHLTGNPHGF
ncbi:hypothetical protein [Desulfosarcina cetonica]|uniref:hypothetical protein n=1 Tax=Desulfosarcina cetonica TaxID=90730 RepID=UPI0030EC9BCA